VKGEGAQGVEREGRGQSRVREGSLLKLPWGLLKQYKNTSSEFYKL